MLCSGVMLEHASIDQSRKAVNGRLRLTVYGQTRTVPVPYKIVSHRLTARVRNRIYGPCLRNFTARLQALVESRLGDIQSARRPCPHTHTIHETKTFQERAAQLGVRRGQDASAAEIVWNERYCGPPTTKGSKAIGSPPPHPPARAARPVFDLRPASSFPLRPQRAALKIVWTISFSGQRISRRRRQGLKLEGPNVIYVLPPLFPDVPGTVRPAEEQETNLTGAAVGDPDERSQRTAHPLASSAGLTAAIDSIHAPPSLHLLGSRNQAGSSTRHLLSFPPYPSDAAKCWITMPARCSRERHTGCRVASGTRRMRLRCVARRVLSVAAGTAGAPMGRGWAARHTHFELYAAS
ncbi:hypothetical protein C8R45DRAFT_947524 [Mycena sanguinolenta]|nr:hypothetical protein C8R45DRAFT_947524 [Mycena sanguinolenta]